MHDYGCTLKAMRAQAAKELTLTGEMHRYIPPLLTWRGYDVDEVEVNHRERRHGDTKYGWERLPKGFMDLVNVWFWQRYSGRPLHVFGGLGIISGVVGTLAGAYSVYLKLAVGQSLSDTALPLFAAFMCLLGLQFFMSGILADIGVKNYFELRDDRGYRIETVLDGGPWMSRTARRCPTPSEADNRRLGRTRRVSRPVTKFSRPLGRDSSVRPVPEEPVHRERAEEHESAPDEPGQGYQTSTARSPR
ncbi:hypothetical protein ACFQL4_08140 [Halosimplex aquaticum]